MGYPGSVHDARIFSSCDISVHSERYFSGPQWIAADSAYKLTETVITPYRKNSRQASEETKKSFNYNFSKYRVRVEHCFGLLKERFSSLKELRLRIHNLQSNVLASKWFIVCCILHNIIQLKKHDSSFDVTYGLEDGYTITTPDDEVNENDELIINEDVRGELKRKALYALISETEK